VLEDIVSEWGNEKEAGDGLCDDVCDCLPLDVLAKKSEELVEGEAVEGFTGIGPHVAEEVKGNRGSREDVKKERVCEIESTSSSESSRNMTDRLPTSFVVSCEKKSHKWCCTLCLSCPAKLVGCGRKLGIGRAAMTRWIQWRSRSFVRGNTAFSELSRK
jgi:hypothetical protein